MPKITTLTFKTKSGWNFEFDVYSKVTKFKDIPALYAFLKYDNGKWRVLYIGQSVHLGDRIANHNKWLEVNRLGCTHIAVCPDVSLLTLDDDERELIEYYCPPCNEQLVP